MKKIALILFSIYYLFPAVGFGITLNWCGSQLHSISFSGANEKTCGCFQMMKAGCCKSAHITVKLPDNQKMESHIAAPVPPAKNITVATTASDPISFLKRFAFKVLNDHAPPISSKPPAYLANNVFRI